MGDCLVHGTLNTSWPKPLNDARLLQTTRLYEEHHNHSRRHIAPHQIPYAQKLQVVTYNVRSLLKPTMHCQLTQSMKTYQVSVLCLQETKSKQTTQYVVDKYTFMTINTSAPQQQEFAGVGFVLVPAARNALLQVELISSRLASLTLLTAAGLLTLINCYAPQSGRPLDEGRSFYEVLQGFVDKLQNKGPYVLVGDFNAQLQGKLLGEDAMLGPFMYGRGGNFAGDDTDNRALLMDFCGTNNLMVGNTWFEHPAGRHVTYHAPGVDHLPSTNDMWDPVQFAQLDLCLVPMRWRNACLNIFSQLRANLDSDHFPVMISLRVKLGATRAM